ncbi:MAG TPA: hypothetical protein VIU45_05180 [Chitinophagaceae bacterium]
MLVIISDLHLTDGTSGEIIDEKAFRIFRNRLSDMAYDASWRRGENQADPNKGYYQPIERLDILLLGDILDVLRSEKWNGMDEINMPWTKNRGDAFFRKLEEITQGIIENNKKSFAILKGIVTAGIQIPAAMHILSEEEKIEKKLGSEASTEKVAVKVNIYYMVGNHDWVLYIDDPRMYATRGLVIDALGLAHEKNQPFPYHPFENEELFRVLQDHRVYAIHGDIFDRTNCPPAGRDGSSIGDAIVIKLLDEIPKKIMDSIDQFIQQYPGSRIGTVEGIQQFVKELHELDNLRPYTLAPAWISQIITKYELSVQFINDAIRAALTALIRDFTINPLVSKQLSTVISMNLAGFLFSSRFSIETLARVIQFFSLNKDNFESYRKYARTLTAAKAGKDKEFFVMGHTHYPEVVPMSSFLEKGQQHSKIYINTGTWRTLHRQGIYDHSFISWKAMTIAGFFKPDERMGHSFEYWTGSLDL